MALIDARKERIAYLKVWLGIMIVTTFSLIGWFVSNMDREARSLVMASGLAALVSAGVVAVLHRRIVTDIAALESE